MTKKTILKNVFKISIKPTFTGIYFIILKEALL